MILAFGESLSLLGLLALCGAAFLVLVWRFVETRRISARWGIVAALTSLPLVAVGIVSTIRGDREYNPLNASIERISGTYTKGNRILVLNQDRTYYSKNLPGLGTGAWSHFDWNLSFQGTASPGPELESPRWILRNGVPAILPYYTGADGADGMLLIKKQ